MIFYRGIIGILQGYIVVMVDLSGVELRAD